jgi:hypothetical protein
VNKRIDIEVFWMSRLRVALVSLGDAMLCVALVLMTEIDKLVNQTLYSYGLQFSLEWAQPYWLMLRISMFSIVAAILLISVVELPVPAFQEKTEEVKQPKEITEAETMIAAEEQTKEEQPMAAMEHRSKEE